MKRIGVLGAGLVSRPLVRHLLGHDDLEVRVADADGERAGAVVGGHPRGRALALSVADAAGLDRFAAECDVLVSLLPCALHVAAAKAALARRRPLVTTSYVSPEMKALDAQARREGVILLNEMGLDPGLDHMSAMGFIDAVRRERGRIVSFRSYCGGIPAPDADTNPWHYKFSWSPRGALLAGRNAARWLEDGRIIDVPGPELFSQAHPYAVDGLPPLEAYPNRDALVYVAAYGIEGVQTMMRGTLRWRGWCETLDAVARLGLLDVAARPWREGTTFAELLEALLHEGDGALRDRAARHVGLPPDHPVLDRLAWAGLFSDAPIGATHGSPLDLLCGLLQGRMAYAPRERDLVVMRHEFGIVGGDGRPRAQVATLVAYGEPGGDSAMSRAVSLPAAVAARLLVDGRIGLAGVRIPVHPEIYEPVLGALAPLGIRFEAGTATIQHP